MTSGKIQGSTDHKIPFFGYIPHFSVWQISILTKRKISLLQDFPMPRETISFKNAQVL